MTFIPEEGGDRWHGGKPREGRGRSQKAKAKAKASGTTNELNKTKLGMAA